jgi:hypothetical protein
MSILDEVIEIANDYAHGYTDTDALDAWLSGHREALSVLEREADEAARVSAFILARVDELQGGYLGDEEARSEVERYLAGHGLLTQGVASQA